MQNNGPSLAQWRSDAFGILHKIYTAKSNVFVNDSGFTEQVDQGLVHLQRGFWLIWVFLINLGGFWLIWINQNPPQINQNPLD